jgi:hypothetical protein
MPAIRGQVQRRFAGLVGIAELRALLDEQLHERAVVFDDGIGERKRAAFGVSGADVGAVRDQNGGDDEVAVPDGVEQRRRAERIALIDVGAAGQQLPDGLQVTGLDGLVEIGGRQERGEQERRREPRGAAGLDS